jgi:nicotinate-nucleotide adenylyltransferase
MTAIGIFGGTFDPIHYGHLRTAFELLGALRLAEVRLVPAARPPHRGAPVCDAGRRLEMLRAAASEQPGFVVDDRELRREGPSYTVTTLRELRAEAPERPLCLIVGMDAFLGLPGWHEWRALLDLAHVVVAHRPGWSAPADGPLGELLAERATDRVEDLHAAPTGRIHVRAVTQLEISSTALRELIVAGHDPRYLLPDAVRAIIRGTGCYQPPPTR